MIKNRRRFVIFQGKGKVYLDGKPLPGYLDFQPVVMGKAEKGRILGSAFSGIDDKNFTLACSGLAESWRAAAEKKYLECHKKLPGSLRTKRLRKKRRDVTLRWFHRWPDRRFVK